MEKVSYVGALKNKYVWIFGLGAGCFGLATVGIMSQLVSYFMAARGYELTGALSMLTIAAVIGMIGSWAWGVVDQKLGTQKACMMFGIWYFIGIAFLIASPTPCMYIGLFMLGGAILLIVAVLFFGIRACVGSNKGNSGDGQKTTSEDQGNVPSSPTNEGESDEKKEDANSMEEADADITALIKSYYKALGEKDIATLKTLEDDFTPSDESKVTNLKDYIEGYEVGDVYTKKGMTDDSYVVYACFSYICQGVETKAPALTQFYVYKNSEGNWVINNGALQDSEISAYMEKQLSDSDVSALIKKVQNELDQAQQSDPSLEEFLNGLGEEAGVSTEAEDGTMLTATEECNVRAEASTDADILGVISAGDQVQKTGTDGEWVQIDYDGQTGYIRGDLLE